MNRKLFVAFLLVSVFFTVAAVPVFQNFGAIRASTVRITGSTGLQMEGNKVDLDTDRDTSITADTDDQIDVEVGGTDLVQIDATGITLSDGDMVIADDIRATVQVGITATDAATFTVTGTYQPIAAAGEVTPTIEAGTAGDFVTLVNTDTNVINIADSGTVALTAAAALGQNDTLTLLSDGTTWFEVSRADN